VKLAEVVEPEVERNRRTVIFKLLLNPFVSLVSRRIWVVSRRVLLGVGNDNSAFWIIHFHRGIHKSGRVSRKTYRSRGGYHWGRDGLWLLTGRWFGVAIFFVRRRSGTNPQDPLPAPGHLRPSAEPREAQ
jgi:hypothetical protein